MKRSVSLFASACALLLAAGAAAQAPAPDTAAWNGERALELIRRAQQRRQEAHADTGLVNYQSAARAYVYFYLDREDTGERNLVKTDQLALEVFWQAPSQVKQRIVGWRDEKSLPTNINYHLDHLSVVQENFGDEIRLGDGDEVRGVPHPAAPVAERFYEYRLSDSLTLRLPGAPEPVRVYELRVRPRDQSRPAFLGSVFVDQRSGDLVRMDFTFTAAAYVDRYLDYINISLDNGLWKGRFWLPNEQRVEIRRRIPQLDVPAGSVIRATMRVGDYRFNQPLPVVTFAGPPVVAAPRAQREQFPFEEDLHAEVREEGLGPQVELAEIRRLASELVREQALRRVSGVLLRLPRASEVLRYNRAEGLALGAGLTFSPAAEVRAGVLGGWAFGASHPLGQLDLLTDALGGRVRGSLYLNRPRDVGVGPVSAGAINTLSALLAGRDYSDPYYAGGAELSLRRPLSPAWSMGLTGRAERQRSAELESEFSVFGGAFRPVREIDETDLMVGGTVELRREAPSLAARRWTLGLALEAGTAEYRALPFVSPAGAPAPDTVRLSFLKPRLEAGWTRGWEARDAELEIVGRAGAAFGDLPVQEAYLIGGRGTVPGYGFRAFGGDRFATLNAVASADLLAPWVRGRALAAAGAAGGGNAGGRSRLWSAIGGGHKTSAGLGLGLVHDIVRVDLVRGFDAGGRWELIVDVSRSFWDFL